MTHKVLKLHRIDEWDGGERHRAGPIHCTTRDVADKVKGKHDTITEVEIAICETADDVPRARDELTALRALSKLSNQERYALGYPSDLNQALAESRDRMRAR